jgi:hypothetical protein
MDPPVPAADGDALAARERAFWLLGAALFVRGVGMGATMMPAMSAAYQTLSRAAIARATTSLNIIQRVGARSAQRFWQ